MEQKENILIYLKNQNDLELGVEFINNDILLPAAVPLIDARCVSTFDENIYSDKCQTTFKRSETNGDDKNKLIGEFENHVNAKPKSFKSLMEQNNSFDCMPQEVAGKQAREMEKLFEAKGKRFDE
uniref:Uncharacterized protein n=1 Tax=Glossina pallidipes TaxID=7398 RepID=A0A1A9ZM84_GLOPL